MNLKKIIKEEMDDLDWIRNIDPNYMEFPKGTQIKITNIGSEEAFLEWLGDFQEDYMDNRYGYRGAIIGFVDESEYYDDGDVKGFYIWETNTSDHIYFPYHRYMNDLNKNDHDNYGYDYSGLNLEYKIIR
jgi:hypothetical protein